jgi:hypothetical protein
MQVKATTGEVGSGGLSLSDRGVCLDLDSLELPGIAEDVMGLEA